MDCKHPTEERQLETRRNKMVYGVYCAKCMAFLRYERYNHYDRRHIK